MNVENERAAGFAEEEVRMGSAFRSETEIADQFVSEPPPTMNVFVNDAVFESVNVGDEPNRRQRHLLDDLIRLHHSLRSPENLLDRGGYSRPLPPRQQGKHRQDRQND